MSAYQKGNMMDKQKLSLNELTEPYTVIRVQRKGSPNWRQVFVLDEERFWWYLESEYQGVEIGMWDKWAEDLFVYEILALPPR
jgi:hypothetical protein